MDEKSALGYAGLKNESAGEIENNNLFGFSNASVIPTPQKQESECAKTLLNEGQNLCSRKPHPSDGRNGLPRGWRWLLFSGFHRIERIEDVENRVWVAQMACHS